MRHRVKIKCHISQLPAEWKYFIFRRERICGASLLRHILELPAPTHAHPHIYTRSALAQWYICGTSQQFAKSQKSQCCAVRVANRNEYSPRSSTHRSLNICSARCCAARSHYNIMGGTTTLRRKSRTNRTSLGFEFAQWSSTCAADANPKNNMPHSLKTFINTCDAKVK